MKSFFFGNYFYGICAISLTIEAALQQQIRLAPIIFYLMLFCVIVVYYTKAYISESTNKIATVRSLWYVHNKNFVLTSQIILTILIGVFCLLLFPNILPGIKSLNIANYTIILIFPFVALLYYGFTNKLSLRNSHWLKPFFIGFVWAGFVTFLPLFYHQLQSPTSIKINYLSWLLFIKNLMYITVLSIMFDIKDYATDYNHQLKTFVVSFGLRKTIFYILIPLTLIGFISFLIFANSHQFNMYSIIFNTIPFLLLLIVAYSLQKRRSIFYYLLIIDGLMLVKAICGSIASFYFK